MFPIYTQSYLYYLPKIDVKATKICDIMVLC